MENKTLPETGFVQSDPHDSINLDAVLDRSETHIGQWNQVISRTNWEKGRIICQWRSDLQSQEQPPGMWSDETWSRMVGGVSPQHVGRLRRTWERFGSTYESYQGLYWSHFYAALDWGDAEMWLEGAVQNHWSVSHMRLQRWETIGGDESEKPDSKSGDIVLTEIDEENQSLTTEDPSSRKEKFSSEPLDEGPDFGDDRDGKTKPSSGMETIEMADVPRLTTQALFERFSNLPEDVAEAVEAFKICIIRHRAAGWREIEQAQMVDVLAALKQLAASNSDAHG